MQPEQWQAFKHFTLEQLPQLQEWVTHLDLIKKCPKGFKKEREFLLFLEKQLSVYHQYGVMSCENIQAVFSWYEPAKLDEIDQAFALKEQVREMRINGVRYVNDSMMSEEIFEKSVYLLAKDLSSLPALHKQALKPDTLQARLQKEPLTIRFMRDGELATWAKYVSESDEILIKQSAQVDNPAYGHAPYIVRHELGHRYEHVYGLPKRYRDSEHYTTKYSQTDSLAASECFAECFAISSLAERYPQYAKQSESLLGHLREQYREIHQRYRVESTCAL